MIYINTILFAFSLLVTNSIIVDVASDNDKARSGKDRALHF